MRESCCRHVPLRVWHSVDFFCCRMSKCQNGGMRSHQLLQKFLTNQSSDLLSRVICCARRRKCRCQCGKGSMIPTCWLALTVNTSESFLLLYYSMCVPSTVSLSPPPLCAMEWRIKPGLWSWKIMQVVWGNRPLSRHQIRCWKEQPNNCALNQRLPGSVSGHILQDLKKSSDVNFDHHFSKNILTINPLILVSIATKINSILNDLWNHSNFCIYKTLLVLV
jgi:hypothetical protein